MSFLLPSSRLLNFPSLLSYYISLLVYFLCFVVYCYYFLVYTIAYRVSSQATDSASSYGFLIGTGASDFFCERYSSFPSILFLTNSSEKGSKMDDRSNQRGVYQRLIWYGHVGTIFVNLGGGEGIGCLVEIRMGPPRLGWPCYLGDRSVRRRVSPTLQSEVYSYVLRGTFLGWDCHVCLRSHTPYFY